MKSNQVYRYATIAALLIFHSFAGYAQDSLLLRQFDTSNIRNCITTLVSKAISDSSKNEILFFNIDAFKKNAYGCRIEETKQSILFKKIHFLDKKQLDGIIKNIQENKKVLFLDMFANPKKYLDTIYLNNYQYLGHNNLMLLLVKIDGAVFFNNFFLRTHLISTTNLYLKSLIMNLQEIAE